MGKFSDVISLGSFSESDDNDSLELIEPVSNLSLEHLEKNKPDGEVPALVIERQTKQMAKLHLNDSKKKTSHPKISSKKVSKKKDYSMKYLKTLSYLEFSSPKVPSKTVSSPVAHSDLRSLHLQVRYSLEQIFAKSTEWKHKSFICNRRFPPNE